MRTWRVEGEPAVWLGSREAEWKRAVREAVPLDPVAPPTTLGLVFTVASLLRGGNPFDLDNMV